MHGWLIAIEPGVNRRVSSLRFAVGRYISLIGPIGLIQSPSSDSPLALTPIANRKPKTVKDVTHP
jgi:hypothetical protein